MLCKKRFRRTTPLIVEINLRFLLSALYPYRILSIEFEIVVRNVIVKHIWKLIKFR